MAICILAGTLTALSTPFLGESRPCVSSWCDSVLVGRSTQDSEVHLLQNAKRFTERIQQQRFHLQQADKFPEAFSTEVSKMREQLLKYQNEYNAVKEREYHNQYRLNR